MKIAILLGTDGADVRSAKICRSLAKLGHEVHFIGWDRRGERAEFELDQVSFHLLDHTVPLGKSTLWAQVKFTRFSLQQLRAIRPDCTLRCERRQCVACSSRPSAVLQTLDM